MNDGGALLGVVLDADVYIDAVSGGNLTVLGDPLDSDMLVLGRPNRWKGRGIVSPADFTERAEAAMRYR